MRQMVTPAARASTTPPSRQPSCRMANFARCSLYGTSPDAVGPALNTSSFSPPAAGSLQGSPRPTTENRDCVLPVRLEILIRPESRSNIWPPPSSMSTSDNLSRRAAAAISCHWLADSERIFRPGCGDSIDYYPKRKNDL